MVVNGGTGDGAVNCQGPLTYRSAAPPGAGAGLAGTPSGMAVIIARAVERGEIDPSRLSPRIASLPLDLVRHDLIMSRSPVPDPALIEIVDRIFLPSSEAKPRCPTNRQEGAGEDPQPPVADPPRVVVRQVAGRTG